MDGFVVFECSWEVVNKVGGIYTVLSSKASFMKQLFRDYFVVGPYFERKAATGFENEKPSPEFQKVFDYLEKKFNIKCYSGHWLVTGRPKCLLIDFSRFFRDKNNIKAQLWNDYRVDSLHAPIDFDEPVVWAKASGLLIEALVRNVFRDQKNIAHFHEWLAGAGLLHLKKTDLNIKTVFTTHATLLGRSIAGSGADLYSEIESNLALNQCASDDRAREFGVTAKHLIEKASAFNADVFTTVSETTAREAEYTLGKRVDLLLPNGLNMDAFYLMEDLSNLHIIKRNKLRKFVLDYFSPYYDVDIKNTLFFYLSGRYEVRNKGIDLFIDSLSDLNNELKKSGSGKTIVAFIFVPSENKGVNVELLKHLALYERLEEEVDEEVKKVKNRLLLSIAKGIPPSSETLLDQQFLYHVKKMLFEFKHDKNNLPPLCAMDVPETDVILKMLKEKGLLNKREDKVKVIYYPAYLKESDGLIGMSYYDTVIACHVGVFPSYYEPWGYTPLESMALGLQSVTSDLSGFGKFLNRTFKEKSISPGRAIKVIKRDKTAYEESKRELASFLLDIVLMDKKERGEEKIRAKNLSYLADWKELVSNYRNAYLKCFT